MALTDTEVRKAKPSDKPQRLFDGGGLYLEVSPAGGKLWRFKYRFGGKEKRQALGKYPEVTATGTVFRACFVSKGACHDSQFSELQ